MKRIIFLCILGIVSFILSGILLQCSDSIIYNTFKIKEQESALPIAEYTFESVFPFALKKIQGDQKILELYFFDAEITLDWDLCAPVDAFSSGANSVIIELHTKRNMDFKTGLYVPDPQKEHWFTTYLKYSMLNPIANSSFVQIETLSLEEGDYISGEINAKAESGDYLQGHFKAVFCETEE